MKGLTFVAAALGALWIAAPASGATVDIGQVAPAGSTNNCIACTEIQAATGAGPSATVPAGSWTVTSWSIRSGTSADGFDQLEVWRPVGGNFLLVAQSASESVIHLATTGAVRTFPTNIAVQQGDVLGIRTGDTPGDVPATYLTSDNGDVTWEVVGDPTLGQTVGSTGNIPTFGVISMEHVNIAATLTSPPTPPTTSKPKKKCKKKHKKKRAAAAKKCKKRKRR